MRYMLMMLLWCGSCAAADLVLQAGAVTREGALGRVAVAVDPYPWLTLEAGVAGVKDGVIGDVTPVLHTAGRVFGRVGIGLGYNAVSNPVQARGLVFRDMAGIGLKATQNVTWTVDVVHYSNGGRLNPLFGREQNSGFTGVVLGVQYKF